MKLIRLIFFLTLIVSHHFGYSKGLFFDDYDWNYDPEFEVVQIDEKDQNAIVLKDLKAIEFFRN